MEQLPATIDRRIIEWNNYLQQSSDEQSSDEQLNGTVNNKNCNEPVLVTPLLLTLIPPARSLIKS